jgi:hypothetical protein
MTEIPENKHSYDEHEPLTNLEVLIQEYEKLKQLQENLIQEQKEVIRSQIQGGIPVLNEVTRNQMQYSIDMAEIELDKLAAKIDKEIFKGQSFRKAFLRRMNEKRAPRNDKLSL